MSPRTGRPKSESPKDAKMQIRADKETLKKLAYCCEKTGLSKSGVIRLGIEKVFQELNEKRS